MCRSMRALKVTLLLCTSLALVLTVGLNYMSSAALEAARVIGLLEDYNTTQIWSQRGTFQNSTITPAGWTFTVWAVIYVYQLLWLVYCWTTVFRRLHPEGDFLCSDPDLAPVGLLVWHFLSALCNMAWILLADRIDYNRTLLIPQTCTIVGIVLCLYCALISSYWSLAQGKEQLAAWGRRADFWVTVALVQNGISLYAGWVTVASFLNIDLTLIFLTSLEADITSFLCLSVLIGLITAYVVADLTVLDPLTRFVFTPHLVVAWACAGSLVKNFQAWSLNTVLTLVLVGIVAVGLLLKLIGICIRTRTSPILRQKVYNLRQAA